MKQPTDEQLEIAIRWLSEGQDWNEDAPDCLVVVEWLKSKKRHSPSKLVPIGSIKVNPNYIESDPDEHRFKLDVIKQNLAAIGQLKPIVVDQNNLCYAGTGTLLAAKELGWTEIRVIQVSL